MSNARKLQTEIDRVMKKVDEGVELFDEIWEKVYSAEQQSQKEKYEIDLKKEIKKLQRLRDQIKTWIGSSDVKDKDSLIDARKLIETKMEQFKVCEKETKTKTYSKEGLARAEKLSPEEQAKVDTCKWVGETIEKLQQCVDERDVQIERLSSGKGKKTNKHLIEEYNEIITSHKYHINKLEGIMRLVMNDRLEAELVNDLKDDIDYYVEAHEEEEYMQSYDEEIFYETLGLDEMDVVNVDRVTQAPTVSKISKSDDASSQSSGLKETKSKKVSSASNIPFTIGRARISSNNKSKDDSKEIGTTPTKKQVSSVTPVTTAPARSLQTNGGASMAAILKRESEQQEKERQKQAALQQAQQQRVLQEQQARAQAEQLRQQQLQQRQQEQLRQQQAAQQKSHQEALQLQQQKLQEQQRQQQEVAAKKQQLQSQQIAQLQQQQRSQQKSSSSSSQGGPIDDLLTSGLGGLSLGNNDSNPVNGSPAATISPQLQGTEAQTCNYDASASYLGALNESFLHCPSNADSERQRTYTPRNPYPTPSSYPSTPALIFDNPMVFEKLGTDALFFIFYYAQGTYQQYLAARELNKQSWRYHKKYMTWFQRHEEPKVKTDEYEQGTYVYFDYETGWCQRIKSDFRFEYSFLEDSLSI